MTDDPLIAFRNARLAEDERTAEALLTATRMAGRMPDFTGCGGPCAEDYWKRFSEGRALREIAARRAILGEQTSDHAPIESIYGLVCRTCVSWQDAPWVEEHGGDTEFGIAIPQTWPCRVARAAVAPWSDHPGYQAAWKL